jgi:predicted transcriptional regulator
MISDILEVLQGSGENATPVTTLMRRGHVSYRGLQNLLEELIGAGLILPVRREDASGYVLTERGRYFLRKYDEFQKFSESFGLPL